MIDRIQKETTQPCQIAGHAMIYRELRPGMTIVCSYALRYGSLFYHKVWLLTTCCVLVLCSMPLARALVILLCCIVFHGGGAETLRHLCWNCCMHSCQKLAKL